jgi:4-diphosphocytidyl-2-C-methyl-D-erythritol kinase
MSSAGAYAKVNLALVVGPARRDGKHEVATVLQRVTLADRITVEHGPELAVTGYAEDSLVRAALLALADAVEIEPRWSVEIEKRIPVAAGLGGGSSDAATALVLANEALARPLPAARLYTLAAELGADIPFFLTQGTQLGTGDGTDLARVELPSDYVVVLLLPSGKAKPSTSAVYDSFVGADGFGQRKAALLEALAANDLGALPPNDLASSPLAADLVRMGAFRADVTGAGPAVYGLFTDRSQAEAAASALEGRGRTWVTAPAR